MLTVTGFQFVDIRVCRLTKLVGGLGVCFCAQGHPNPYSFG